ncbi:MAG: SRPBCC domain-containing protein [Parvularculaceae bacterium]
MTLTDNKVAVKVEAVIPGSPEAAFDAWIAPDKLEQWFCGGKTSSSEAYVCAHEGGCYLIVMKGDRDWPHAGNYLEVSRGKRLRFTWYTPSTIHQRSEVDVRFEKVEDGVRVAILHSGLPPDMEGGFRDGWAELLANLAAIST